MGDDPHTAGEGGGERTLSVPEAPATPRPQQGFSGLAPAMGLCEMGNKTQLKFRDFFFFENVITNFLIPFELTSDSII